MTSICETCAHWRQHLDGDVGICHAMTDPATNSFGIPYWVRNKLYLTAKSQGGCPAHRRKTSRKVTKRKK